MPDIKIIATGPRTRHIYSGDVKIGCAWDPASEPKCCWVLHQQPVGTGGQIAQGYADTLDDAAQKVIESFKEVAAARAAQRKARRG